MIEERNRNERRDESSVLTSLEQIMGWESERIESEVAAEQLAKQAALKASDAAREVAREAEERRQAVIQKKREDAALSRRLEEARIQAVQEAIVRKAQAQEQFRQRLRENEAQAEHEQALARISRDVSKRRLRRQLAGVLVATLGIAIGAGAWMSHEVENREQEARRLKSETERQTARYREAKRDLQEALQAKGKRDQERIEGLRARLRELDTSDSGSVEPAPSVTPQKRPTNPRPPVQAPTSRKPLSDCADGDPMCSDLSAD